MRSRKASGVVLRSGQNSSIMNLRSAVPPGPSGKVITRIHPICANANSSDDEKAAAKTFIEWLYAQDNISELMERSLDVVPPYPGAINEDYLDTLFWADGYLEGEPITPVEIMGDFINFNQEFGNVVMNKFAEVLVADRPIEDAMEEAQEELEALAELDQESQHSIQLHHRAERWRDRIVDEGNGAIDALLQELPDADRQKLRQLWRNHDKAPSDAKRTQHARLIYQEIKKALDG